MRGNGPTLDGRNRGPVRANWKDNENNQQKTRVNRGFDGQKDNRKLSRWGNNSPKSIVSEESWDADATNSPKKQNKTQAGENSNDKEPKDTVKTNQPQNETIADNSSKNDVSEIQNKEKSPMPQEQHQQLDKSNSQNLESSNTNSNQNKMPSETSISETKGATNSTNNQQRDNNTTPLYDEPAEERSYPGKDKMQNQQSSAVTKDLPILTESSGNNNNNNNNNSTSTASVVESTAESNVPETETKATD